MSIIKKCAWYRVSIFFEKGWLVQFEDKKIKAPGREPLFFVKKAGLPLREPEDQKKSTWCRVSIFFEKGWLVQFEDKKIKAPGREPLFLLIKWPACPVRRSEKKRLSTLHTFFK